MAGWQLNPALTRFRDAVNARYGARRDMESDGTIGDRAHASRSSDHNPDDDGSVDAWDMDVDVNGRGRPYAADVEALKKVFQAHESSSYWIHNDQIAKRSEGWVRRSYAYAGPSRNRHTQHVHWNTRQSHEGSTAPWILEDDMTPQELLNTKIGSPALGTFTVADWLKKGEAARREAAAANAKLTALADAVAALGGPGASKALMEKLQEIDDEATARDEADRQRDADLSAQVAALPAATVEAFGAADTPEQIAERLKAALGDKAAEVGAILAAG
jgi:hypothetical protein